MEIFDLLKTPEVSIMITPPGVALMAGMITQWLKLYVKKAVLVNLLCLILSLAFAELAQFVLFEWHPDAAAIITAFWNGIIGASLATFGYEAIKNMWGTATQVIKPAE